MKIFPLLSLSLLFCQSLNIIDIQGKSHKKFSLSRKKYKKFYKKIFKNKKRFKKPFYSFYDISSSSSSGASNLISKEYCDLKDFKTLEESFKNFDEKIKNFYSMEDTIKKLVCDQKILNCKYKKLKTNNECFKRKICLLTQQMSVLREKNRECYGALFGQEAYNGYDNHQLNAHNFQNGVIKNLESIDSKVGNWSLTGKTITSVLQGSVTNYVNSNSVLDILNDNSITKTNMLTLMGAVASIAAITASSITAGDLTSLLTGIGTTLGADIKNIIAAVKASSITAADLTSLLTGIGGTTGANIKSTIDAVTTSGITAANLQTLLTGIGGTTGANIKSTIDAVTASSITAADLTFLLTGIGGTTGTQLNSLITGLGTITGANIKTVVDSVGTTWTGSDSISKALGYSWDVSTNGDLKSFIGTWKTNQGTISLADIFGTTSYVVANNGTVGNLLKDLKSIFLPGKNSLVELIGNYQSMADSYTTDSTSTNRPIQTITQAISSIIKDSIESGFSIQA